MVVHGDRFLKGHIVRRPVVTNSFKHLSAVGVGVERRISLHPIEDVLAYYLPSNTIPETFSQVTGMLV